MAGAAVGSRVGIPRRSKHDQARARWGGGGPRAEQQWPEPGRSINDRRRQLHRQGPLNNRTKHWHHPSTHDIEPGHHHAHTSAVPPVPPRCSGSSGPPGPPGPSDQDRFAPADNDRPCSEEGTGHRAVSEWRFR